MLAQPQTPLLPLGAGDDVVSSMGECEDLGVRCCLLGNAQIHPATISVATTRIAAMNQGKVSPVSRSCTEVEFSGPFTVAFHDERIARIRLQVFDPGVIIIRRCDFLRRLRLLDGVNAIRLTFLTQGEFTALSDGLGPVVNDVLFTRFSGGPGDGCFATGVTRPYHSPLSRRSPLERRHLCHQSFDV